MTINKDYFNLFILPITIGGIRFIIKTLTQNNTVIKRLQNLTKNNVAQEANE